MRSEFIPVNATKKSAGVISIVIMPANAVEFIDLPGIAVKATISNIVWVGGEK